MQKEPTHFFRICNIAKRSCRDSRFQERVNTNKERWKDPSLAVLGWHNDITITEFLDAHFNQFLFHVRQLGGSENIVALLAERLGPEATQVALFGIAYERLLILRNLHWLLKPCLSGQNFFRIPD